MGYTLRVAQSETDLAHQKLHLERGTRLVTDLQDFLAKFTITAPAPGMVIYKKDRNGTKRKAGSNVNAFDRIIATLPDLSSMISKTYVNEIEISKVKIGQKVNITIDAFPDKMFTGTVSYIANVGEQLPNSDAKVFEVQIKIDGSDQSLRPSMTTTNRIIIKTFDNVVYIPTECVQTGTDSIPFVYEKNKTKQIVVLGEMNEKNVIIKQGLNPGTTLYITTPDNPETFRLKGEEFIPTIKMSK
jgi:multidrug efflux pump subunit AcrA (membrane-fusion protein)